MIIHCSKFDSLQTIVGSKLLIHIGTMLHYLLLGWLHLSTTQPTVIKKLVKVYT